eukprot:scaffold25422_cov80-Phaeocystis_antarctica.AAC.3
MAWCTRTSGRAQGAPGAGRACSRCARMALIALTPASISLRVTNNKPNTLWRSLPAPAGVACGAAHAHRPVRGLA